MKYFIPFCKRLVLNLPTAHPLSNGSRIDLSSQAYISQSANLNAVFREYFLTLPSGRQRNFSDPDLFIVRCMSAVVNFHLKTLYLKHFRSNQLSSDGFDWIARKVIGNVLMFSKVLEKVVHMWHSVEYRFRGNTLYINIPLVHQGPSKMWRSPLSGDYRVICSRAPGAPLSGAWLSNQFALSSWREHM